MSGPESRRYADPATELTVLRLTDPVFASGMSAPHLHHFGRRAGFLLYWSDRGGTRQAFQLDLKTAESRQVTDAESLDPGSLTLSADERSFFFFDGRVLRETVLTTLHTRDVYSVPAEATRTGITVGGDGSLFFSQSIAGRVRIVRVSRFRTGPVAEFPGTADLVMARPHHSQLLCRVNGEIWLMNFDGSGRRRLIFEPGQTNDPLWTPTGHSVTYLHDPVDPRQLVTAREYLPDENADRLIAKTSQFATLSSNSDGSVFVGASRSKASSYVLILLRVTQRELTLCEHRASNPQMAFPVFAPDSQSVFFVSDRDGQAAIYRIHIEKFVEQTTDDTP